VLLAITCCAALFLDAGQGGAAIARHMRDARVTAGGVDPDTLPKGSADAVVVVRWLAPDSYQLEVQNTSGYGAIDSFNWVSPVNLTITAVTSSEGGRCALVSGDIQCTVKLAAPSCTCAAGGDMTVNFTATGLAPTYANGYWTFYGIVGSYLQIQSMTPIPFHIPSFQSPQNVDLPVCKKGQPSTAYHPCVIET
jgi:hypothetical protein